MAPTDPLVVLHADNHLLVVSKPAGLPSVPDASGDTSLFELAKAWIKVEYEKPGEVFLGIVQRLDRPVSGVLVFARTSKAAARLNKAFAGTTAHKTYLGIGAPDARAVRELVPGASGELVQWLQKDHDKNRVQSFSSEPAGGGAKRAVTRWRVLAVEAAEGPMGNSAPRCLFELEPVTGRSHQLRVACRSLGAPLVGDLKYAPGSRPLPDKSIALHARRLELEHPTRRERLTFEAPPPAKAWWRIAEGG